MGSLSAVQWKITLVYLFEFSILLLTALFFERGEGFIIGTGTIIVLPKNIRNSSNNNEPKTLIHGRVLVRRPRIGSGFRIDIRRDTYLFARNKKNNRNSRKNNHDKPMDYEKSLQRRGYKYVIGTDEVGRGSIAGPVVAVSCCIILNSTSSTIIHDNNDATENDGGIIKNRFRPIDGVTDSKLLTAEQRKIIYDQIHNDQNGNDYKYAYSVAQRSPKQIQETNILKATMECFQESIQNLILSENLPLEQTYAVVDGKSTPKLVNGPTPVSCRPYVSADKDIYTVSVASILAKVMRDEMMVEASSVYPEYGFDVNKGYSTKEHIEAIHNKGPCPIHRMSFKPLHIR